MNVLYSWFNPGLLTSEVMVMTIVPMMMIMMVMMLTMMHDVDADNDQ
jgi:hypothetical protein